MLLPNRRQREQKGLSTFQYSKSMRCLNLKVLHKRVDNFQSPRWIGICRIWCGITCLGIGTWLTVYLLMVWEKGLPGREIKYRIIKGHNKGYTGEQSELQILITISDKVTSSVTCDIYLDVSRTIRPAMVPFSISSYT